MADITDADAIIEEPPTTDTPTEQPKKDLADICKRYMESQKELMEVVVALLVRLVKFAVTLQTNEPPASVPIVAFVAPTYMWKSEDVATLLA